MNDNDIDRALRTAFAEARPTPTAAAAMDTAFTAIAQDAAFFRATSTTQSPAPAAARAAAFGTTARDAGCPSPAAGAPNRILGTSRPRRGIGTAPRWIRAAAVTCAVCLGVGGTAYAADALGLINLQRTAPYQVMMGIEDPAGDAGGTVPDVVDHYRLTLGYEPAGLHRDPGDMGANGTFDGRFADFYSDDFKQSLKVSVLYHDTDEAFPVSFVADSETVDVNGRTAVLITSGAGAESRYLQLFIPFSDEHRVVVVGADETLRDELLAVARGVSLEAAGTVSREHLWLLSDFLAPPRNEGTDDSALLQASHEQMGNLHAVGDTFPLSADDAGLFDRAGGDDALAVQVTEVTCGDNLNALDCGEMIPDEWRALADADGTLRDAEITFRTWGDGVNSLDEVVATRTVPLTLVQAKVSYTNASDEAMDDVLFFGGLLSATEGVDGYRVFDRTSQVPGADDARMAPSVGTGEMFYYDVDGKRPTDDPDSPNYIRHLEPGQTATVTMAWLVPSDEVGQLFLTLNSSGYCFDEDALALGYVDVRP